MSEAGISRQAGGSGGRLSHLTSGRARATVAGWGWSFVNIGVTTLLTAAVFLVTSRVLEPADFGAVALAVAVVALISAAVPLAFSEALVQRADLRPDHLNSVFWLCGGVALLAYAGLMLLSPTLAVLLDVPLTAQILPVLGLRLVFEGLAPVPAALIQRRMQFRTVALRTVLANGCGAVVCLGLVAAGLPLWGLVASQVASSAIGLGVSAFAARWRPDGRPRATALRDLRNFGLYSIGSRVLNEARLDQLLLGALLGPAALGLYAFARRLFQMLADLTAGAFSAVSGVLFASLQTESDKRRDAFLLASFASTALAFPVFSGLIVVAPAAVPMVFGAQWHAAVFPVQMLAGIGMMAGIGIIQAALIRNLGQASWWFWYQATGVSLDLLAIVLLWRFGLDAIMAAGLLRTIALWPFSLRKTQSLLGMTLRSYLGGFGPTALAAGAMCAALLALPHVLSGLTGVELLASQIGLGAAVYVAVLAFVARRRVLGLVQRVKAISEATR